MKNKQKPESLGILNKGFTLYPKSSTGKGADKWCNTRSELSQYFRRKLVGTGFTLIELLVVVAIIGVLATLLMTNFVGVRQRARDQQRKSDLRQIQTALELYRSDQGAYPSAPLPACNASLTNTGGTATYMQKTPCDPMGSSINYNGGQYFYTSTGTVYTLAACLENANDPQGTSTSPGGTGSCASGKYMVVQNP